MGGASAPPYGQPFRYTGRRFTVPWRAVRGKQVFELRRRKRFLEIIRRTKLHDRDTAVHLQATRQHYLRHVPVACQSKLYLGVCFKGRADDDEVKRLVVQVPLCLLVIRKSADHVSHALQ